MIISAGYRRKRSLSDRTINACISQLRFFTMYVLHKPWDPTQLPMRKFDSYLPFVPTQKEADIFISTLSDLKPKAMISLMYSAASGSGKSVTSVTVISNGKICGSMSHTPRTVPTVMQSFQRRQWTSLPGTGLHTAVQPDGFSRNRQILPVLSTPFISAAICGPMKLPLDGSIGSPAIPSGMLLVPISMKMGRTF